MWKRLVSFLENGKFCCRRRPSFLHALQRMVQTKSPPLFDPCTRPVHFAVQCLFKAARGLSRFVKQLGKMKIKVSRGVGWCELESNRNSKWVGALQSQTKAAQSYHKCCLQPTSFGDLHTLATCLSQRCHFFSSKKIYRSRDYSYKPYSSANVHFLHELV